MIAPNLLRRQPMVEGLTWLFALALMALPAWSSIQSDRLLARTDSRLLAAAWIRAQFPAGAVIYQSGSLYGHVQMPTADSEAARDYPEVALDEQSGAFLGRQNGRNCRAIYTGQVAENNGSSHPDRTRVAGTNHPVNIASLQQIEADMDRRMWLAHDGLDRRVIHRDHFGSVLDSKVEPAG